MVVMVLEFLGGRLHARWRKPVSNASRWKKIFGSAKSPTVTVQVGAKSEDMTDTQAYRFEELKRNSSQILPKLNVNPLEQARYSLDDAAFRLMTNKADILQRAAAGSIKFYVNAAGFSGRWRRMDGPGDTAESSIQTIRSGYLELTNQSCKQLSLHDHASVSVFVLPDVPDPSGLVLDNEMLQELSAWGGGMKCFCVIEPQRVNREEIILLGS